MKGQNKLQNNSDTNFNKFLIEFLKAVGMDCWMCKQKSCIAINHQREVCFHIEASVLKSPLLSKRVQHLNLKKRRSPGKSFTKMYEYCGTESDYKALSLALSPKENSITIPIVIMTISGTLEYLQTAACLSCFT